MVEKYDKYISKVTFDNGSTTYYLKDSELRDTYDSALYQLQEMFDTRDASFTSLYNRVSSLESDLSTLETATASSLVFKGTVSSATGITSLTNYEVGWTYKASASFTVTGLGTVENGDMFVCIASGSSYSASDWNIVQNNVDTMTAATSSSAGTRGLVPAPAAGKQSSFLRGDGTWATPTQEDTWGTF